MCCVGCGGREAEPWVLAVQPTGTMFERTERQNAALILCCTYRKWSHSLLPGHTVREIDRRLGLSRTVIRGDGRALTCAMPADKCLWWLMLSVTSMKAVVERVARSFFPTALGVSCSCCFDWIMHALRCIRADGVSFVPRKFSPTARQGQAHAAG